MLVPRGVLQIGADDRKIFLGRKIGIFFRGSAPRVLPCYPGHVVLRIKV